MAAITQEVGQWLEESGYRNFGFISYAHTGDTELTEFAGRLQAAIEKELKFEIDNPRVYIDAKYIPPGAIWPDDLRRNLSASVALIAVLTPIYLSVRHEWCGKEWAAMERLGMVRLPNTSIQPIIPVMFRRTTLPPGAANRQPLDLSRNALLGPRYYTTKEFRAAVLQIVDQIREIACLRHQNRSAAGPNGFQFPLHSAFEGFEQPPQRPPLRSGG